jgi:glycosyltransferase involved in cell wall biosynthesis
VWRESDFIVYFQLAKEWPDVFVYIPVNSEAEIPKEYKLPNVGYLQVGRWFPFGASQALISDELYGLFNPINGKYQVDAIITSKTVAASLMKRLYWLTGTVSVPVLILEPKAAGLGFTHDEETEVDLKLRSLSYSECPTFFATKREKEMAVGEARRHLVSSGVEKVIRNGVVRSQGIPAQYVANVCKKVEKFSNFSLLFAARFNSNKRWQDVMDVFEDYKKSNRDVELHAVGPKPPDLLFSRYKSVKVHASLPYPEYVEMLNRCHVSVSMSDEEGFAAGWAEQICTGNPVLLPDKPWAHALTYTGGDSYPFLYKSKTELLALIKWCQQNYGKARVMMLPFSEYFVKNHDIAAVASDILKVVDRACEGTYDGFHHWKIRLAAIIREMPFQTFTISDLIEAAGKQGIILGSEVKEYSLGSARNVYRWLCSHYTMMYGLDTAFKKGEV